MSWIVESFAGIELPRLDEQPRITAAYRPRFVETVNGRVRRGGAQPAQLMGRNVQLNVTEKGAMDDLRDRLAAYLGNVRTLVLAHTLSQERRVQEAELITMPFATVVGRMDKVSDFSFGWELMPPFYWDGIARSYTTNGGGVDGSDAFDVVNSGNATVMDCIVTVAAVGSDITAVNLSTDQGVDFGYAETIEAGDTLHIDVLARRAWLASAPTTPVALSFGVSHVMADWLPIQAGGVEFAVGKDGGSSADVITLAYNDAWGSP